MTKKKRKRDPRWRIGDVLLSANNTLNLVRDTDIDAETGRRIYKMYGIHSSSPTWRYSYNYRKVGHHDGTVASWTKYPQVLKRSGHPSQPDNISRWEWINALKRGPDSVAYLQQTSSARRQPLPYLLVEEEIAEKARLLETNRANKRKIRRII